MSPIVLRSRESDQVWLSSDVYTIAVPGSATDGTLSVVDAWVPPGGGPPPHIHVDALEVILVQSGEVTVYIGGESEIVGPGDAAVIPVGVVHNFHNHTATPSRIQFLFTPSGTEQFFLDAGVPTRAGVPIPMATAADHRRAAAIGSRYGLRPGEQAEESTEGTGDEREI